MPDREKVIKGLECCDHDSWGDHEECPYDRKDNDGICLKELIHDVHILLKAQEPRVMTLEEIDGVQEHNCEYYTECLIEPNMGYARICYDGEGHMCMIKGTRYDVREDMYDYGKTWRCWTSRPTDEQKEATAWN